MDMAKSKSNAETEALVPAGELLTRALAAYQQQPPRFTGTEPPASDGSISLAHYLWVFKRYRWHMLSFVALCTIATFVISSRLYPMFESTATLDVDRDAPAGVVGEESRNVSSNLDADQYIATQMHLIESDSVLRPVVRKFNLLQYEHDTGFRHRTDKVTEPTGPIGLQRLTVSRALNTYLIQITYRAPNAVLAANVANAIAKSYLERSYEIRAHASGTLSKFMEGQLDELRAKMEKSGLALAQFEKELNVINPEDKTNILSARLIQLNTAYTDAQADRIKKEASFNSNPNGSADAGETSTQGDAIKKLQDRLNDASEKFASVKEQYGPNHPEYIKAAALVREIQTQFDATRQGVRRRTEIEYREAVNKEAMLRQSVAQTKAEYDSLNAHSFQYKSLKDEADADKKLFDELEGKIKESTINSGFANRNVRVADDARPGDGPVSPNIPLNVLLTFILSTFMAIGGAVLADAMDNTIRDPEQVTRELKTNLIGSLPMSRDWKFRFGPTEAIGNGSSELVKAEAISPGTKLLEESVRVLHSSILLSDMDRRIRSILITSASPRDGKSTTSALLATTNAQQGKKTLLIDGDLRRPSMDRFFSVNSSVGLSNVVLGEMPWRDVVVPVERVPNLDLMTAGPPSHRALEMAGAGMEAILEQATREYALIIIDSAPLMNFAEPLQMATLVDGVVIVSVAGETNRKAVASVLTRLTRMRANVIGLVLNKVTKNMTDSYEYYGYGKYAANYYNNDRTN
jgi:capsular exopolysaccharide synthesis family protein